MKWKSFTLRLLLLVMVGKRIKEPGIFTVVSLEVTRNESIFRFPRENQTKCIRARARARVYTIHVFASIEPCFEKTSIPPSLALPSETSRLFIVYKVFNSFVRTGMLNCLLPQNTNSSTSISSALYRSASCIFYASLKEMTLSVSFFTTVNGYLLFNARSGRC